MNQRVLELSADRVLGYSKQVLPFPGQTVFSHGNLGSNLWWEPLLGAMQTELKANAVPQGEGHFIEWLGCGQSSSPLSAKDLEIPEMAKNFLRALQKLDISKCQAVGHSTGGLVLIQAAIFEPTRFEKIFLIDTVPAKGVKMTQEMRETFLKMSRDRSFCETVMMSTIQNIDSRNAYFQKLVDGAFHVHPLLWTEIPKALESIDLSDKLSALEMPIMAVHGRHDPICQIADSKELIEQLPNGHFLELSDAGHSPNVENPKEIAKILQSFFRKG